jgi:flavin reductase (DIM6/NTAB) family NADH-FMN oxidoreductase RutF
MEFDFRSISAQNRYKLLVSLIVPRPIAWVSTCNPNGSINVAPFSFFNAIGSDPALIVLGIGDHADRPKDTAVNIEKTSEFVVNLVTESQAQSMSDSATDFPPDVSEVEELGLQTASSSRVTPPRIVGSPAALECKLERILTIGQNRIVIGEVLVAWVEDLFVMDFDNAYIDTNAFKLIGRMNGPGGYASTRDTFQIDRKKYGN